MRDRRKSYFWNHHVQRKQSLAHNIASGCPSRVVKNPNSEAAPRGQNKTLAVEDTIKMFNAQNSLSKSKIGLYNSNQAVIICGLAESNSDVASERIQSGLKQFTETVSSIFKNSQEIKVLKACRMESTFFQRDYHPKERQKMRELRTELSLRQKRGEKHRSIKDGEIVTAPLTFLSRSAVAITIGGQNPPPLRL